MVRRPLLTNIPSYFTPILLTLFSTFILWLPFLLKLKNIFGIEVENVDFSYIYRHFDGLLYIIVAKSWYYPFVIQNLGIELPIGPEYFAAHLPLYPFLISISASVIGYLKGMIVVTLLSSMALSLVFFYVIRYFNLTKHPVLLTAVFMMFPRLLIVRSVGAPEALFLFLILLSLYFFEKKEYLFAGLFGGLSVMTKTPGVLLFAAYISVAVEQYLRTRKVEKGIVWTLLIPLGLICVFIIQSLGYGDFFAYFKSGDNIHLAFPFSVFNFQKIWIGTAWLEDIVFTFFLYGLAVVYLWKSKHRSFFYFTVIFFVATICIQHRDISRYSLPMWAMACIAFDQFFTSKKFWIIFLILVPGIFLFAWNFLLYNVMPISNWAPYL
ncbi:MAG: glycosyltransferase family 39 protein [bacterium]|nr:glycosyltransferase family 39 protein [bacterium]